MIDPYRFMIVINSPEDLYELRKISSLIPPPKIVKIPFLVPLPSELVGNPDIRVLGLALYTPLTHTMYVPKFVIEAARRGDPTARAVLYHEMLHARRLFPKPALIEETMTSFQEARGMPLIPRIRRAIHRFNLYRRVLSKKPLREQLIVPHWLLRRITEYYVPRRKDVAKAYRTALKIFRSIPQRSLEFRESIEKKYPGIVGEMEEIARTHGVAEALKHYAMRTGNESLLQQFLDWELLAKGWTGIPASSFEI
jgi:hypothetical protein